MTLESPSSAALARFHDVLVDEIRERRPEYLAGHFTVAEIYQQLVPYASHRDRLGVEMNGDYEDVLLRLLAGEGDYLVVESEHARERMQQEVASSNPDTSLFREFAAVDVRLNQARVPDADGDAQPSPGSVETPSADRDDAPAFDLDDADEVYDDGVTESPDPPSDRMPGGDAPTSPVEGHPEPSPDHPAVAPAASTTSAESTATCSWCRETLPARDKLNFCPFCGTDVNVVPCESCGEALEPGWLFCIACGTGVSTA